jgi:DNA-binding transcriptional regulator YiaG
MTREYKDRDLREINAKRLAVPEQIKTFLKKYNLSAAGFGRMITTPAQTVRQWQKGGSAVPPVLVSIMYLLENSEEVRELLGISRFKVRPRIDRTKPRKLYPHEERKRRDRLENNAPNPKYHLDPNEFIEGPVDMWDKPKKAAQG